MANHLSFSFFSFFWKIYKTITHVYIFTTHTWRAKKWKRKDMDILLKKVKSSEVKCQKERKKDSFQRSFLYICRHSSCCCFLRKISKCIANRKRFIFQIDGALLVMYLGKTKCKLDKMSQKGVLRSLLLVQRKLYCLKGIYIILKVAFLSVKKHLDSMWELTE